MKPSITKITIGKRNYQFANVPKDYFKIVIASLMQIEKSAITNPDKAIKAKPVKRKTNKKLGSTVKRYRKKLGMSQGALAKKLMMTQGNISQIETGRIGISEDLAKRMGKILGIGYRKFL
jgi:ribosome-binding protein aMBF1 (putative translation factor)